jgi:hypothetical protein
MAYPLDGRGVNTTSDILHKIARKNIECVSPWSKMGFSPTVNTTESDIWSLAGVYTFCATAGVWEVVSSDNTKDKATTIFSGTASGGSETTLIDVTKNFTGGTAVVAGDCVILDKSGTTPEWGYVTGVSATTLTIAGGFSSDGTASGRAYAIIDKSAYTGAQAVKIEYLTSAYAQKSEIVILNGTTAVDTVNTDLFRVNSFRVIATGTDNKPTGNLTLRGDGASGNYSYITAGFTRARNVIYTVPANKTLYVTNFSAGWGLSAAIKDEYARIYTRVNREPSTGFNTGSLFYPCTEVIIKGNMANIELLTPTRIPEKSDIKVSALATASGSAVVVLRGWLEDN